MVKDTNRNSWKEYDENYKRDMEREYEKPSVWKWDFVVEVGPTVPEGAPRSGLLNTPEANTALQAAYEWAVSKAPTSSYANAAKVYIEGIEENRKYSPDDTDRADDIQLLYIISNLTYWRGEGSKEGRKVLKEYRENLVMRIDHEAAL
jgi:hypothetical protein